MTTRDIYNVLTPEKRLKLHIEVYIFDDQQPLTRPKAQWILVAKFNEMCCAKDYVKMRMEKRYIKAMKIFVPSINQTTFEVHDDFALPNG